MIYISPANEYPRHIGDIQLEHPDWKPENPLPEGWKKVEEAPRPTVKETEVAFEGFPVEVKGVWIQNWEVRELTAEELERRNAPKTAREKLKALGLTDIEIEALTRGF